MVPDGAGPVYAGCRLYSPMQGFDMSIQTARVVNKKQLGPVCARVSVESESADAGVVGCFVGTVNPLGASGLKDHGERHQTS